MVQLFKVCSGVAKLNILHLDFNRVDLQFMKEPSRIVFSLGLYQ